MTTKIETPEDEDARLEFLRFHDRVYQYRRARRREFVPLSLPILEGKGPFAEGRTMRPFVTRRDGAICARVLAVVDHRYNRHWTDRLGHLLMFEALPDTRDAVVALLDAACEWLAGQQVDAARAGMGMLEFPFVIDDYESLPPIGMRYNPPYYHALLKEAGLVVERSLVDYRIEVRPELIARYEDALTGARAAGYAIVPLREVPQTRRMADFTATYNEAFAAHWGMTPFTVGEMSMLITMEEPLGVLDTSVIAYRGDEPVGAVWAVPHDSGLPELQDGSSLAASERVNFLGIGVREAARGRGVNLAMAGYAYLEMVRRGATHLSYTLVLDDNWPSRRTAAKLGAHVCANYVVYRRDFGAPGPQARRPPLSQLARRDP